MGEGGIARFPRGLPPGPIDARTYGQHFALSGVLRYLSVPLTIQVNNFLRRRIDKQARIVSRVRKEGDDRHERERPNGQVIQMDKKRMPGGGYVATYSDVTARRHDEEDVHALSGCGLP